MPTVTAREIVEKVGLPHLNQAHQDYLNYHANRLAYAVNAIGDYKAHNPIKRLLDIGLGFEVAGAFGISVAQFWNGFVPVEVLHNRFGGIPWESAWIIVFPMIAPNTPRKVMAASLASAMTMGILYLSATVTAALVMWLLKGPSRRWTLSTVARRS